jgi:hypothetical protein
MQAELALREMRRVGLLDALDYCALLAAEHDERFEPAAIRWLSVLRLHVVSFEVEGFGSCVGWFACGRVW